MRILNPNQLTIDQALTIAKAAILDIIGDDSYEMCRLYYEEGMPMGELAVRHGVTRQRICQRINATHVTLRRLSTSCGIRLMPESWENKPARNGAKSCQFSS